MISSVVISNNNEGREFINYYQILDLKPNATEVEIRKKYLKLALKWHPDKSTDKVRAEYMFKLINEAYQVLIDYQKRQTYDEILFDNQNIWEDDCFTCFFSYISACYYYSFKEY